MANLRDAGWAYFDAIVAAAPLRDSNPWQGSPGGRPLPTYVPDYDTLELLLGVPVHLGAASQCGVPALALDVWVAYEFRRAGFDPDRVWPRATAPRVLPAEVTEFVARLPRREQAALLAMIGRGRGGSGTANLLGKNYVKQVDVVMSSWATGPELMVSTKRMDASFGKNAANRVEESYGDAKNLRLRHPQAALGFVYALSAVALDTSPDIAAWLIDLLIKLGREDDAYDAVALVLPEQTEASTDSTTGRPAAASRPAEPPVPGLDSANGPTGSVGSVSRGNGADLAGSGEPEEPDEPDEPDEPAGPIQPGIPDGWGWPNDPALLPLPAGFDISEPTPGPAAPESVRVDLDALPRIRLQRGDVPAELDPARFFRVMSDRLLDNSPVNFHAAARARRRNPDPC